VTRTPSQILSLARCRGNWRNNFKKRLWEDIGPFRAGSKIKCERQTLPSKPGGLQVTVHRMLLGFPKFRRRHLLRYVRTETEVHSRKKNPRAEGGLAGIIEGLWDPASKSVGGNETHESCYFSRQNVGEVPAVRARPRCSCRGFTRSSVGTRIRYLASLGRKV